MRQAREEDADVLTELTLESKAYWGYSKDFIERCRPYLKITKDYVENWPVKLIEEDEEIVGYFSLKIIDDENRLDNLWIKPKYIRNGYGKILFQEAVKEAHALGWTYFRLAGEENAVMFYEKQGAKLIGKIQSRLREDIYLPHMEYKLG